MAETTIEWTRGPNGEPGFTFNPWEGCEGVSPGCLHCYAEARNARFGGGVAANWGPGAPRRRTSEANWRKPLAWNAAAKAAGTRYRVFCASLADVFDNQVPVEWRHDLFRLILDTPHLDWLLLTKRIGNVPKMISADQWEHLGNVWIGATVVNQEEADRDLPKLIGIPAAVRFLSIEPLLGPIDLHPWVHGGWMDKQGKWHRDIHWVIAGGESGPGARDCEISSVRTIVRQCKAAGVAVHVKQLGASPIWNGISSPGEHWPAGTLREDRGLGHWHMRLKHKKGGDWNEWPEDLRIRQFPEESI